ncbi:lysine--tRNA ligase [Aureliella helgolandensis]|uniref:Lysine--tRNA ligase n=1 Tax=Aureliella helgolandensis TaxID=2527968 RepID=A0A518G797_9BACT|nr:lysine--tRNA ligase [Aureliella helgolandensis]QDV24458.1 Lysine--tRNA ligase [Aureliella helgolandensis]
MSDAEDPRLVKLNKITALGVDPWGHHFPDRDWNRDVRGRSSELKYQLEDGTQLDLPEFSEAANSGTTDADSGAPAVDYRQWKKDAGAGEETGPNVRVAGRIILMRPTGKLIFIKLRDWTGDIQIFIGKAQVGEADFELAGNFDLGDWIAVEGRLGRTNTGELTVFAAKLHFMCKTLETPPEKHAGLQNPELKQRQRYLDLTYNEGVMDTFLARTKIVQSIRSTLAGRGYCEIEGPTLHTIAGGAAARPFLTHHNTLEMPLVLRIALELHLKRLLVGGMERVYELGRVYRNEGISPRHNPEFTMLEAYEAFGNYEVMMDLTEQIILDALAATGQGHQVMWNDKPIDFSPPFQRRTYDELFSEATQLDPTDVSGIAALAKKLNLKPEGKHSDVVKSEVFEETVEEGLIGPIFVTDYPSSICPLTKRKTSNPQVAERFELFIHGMELANAYTELNDPILQEELFRTQLEGQAAEDSMANMDHDFVLALRNGMPPAGGLGIGIDRLVMLLTNSRSIRDIILFPLLRNQAN